MSNVTRLKARRASIRNMLSDYLRVKVKSPRSVRGIEALAETLDEPMRDAGRPPADIRKDYHPCPVCKHGV